MHEIRNTLFVGKKVIVFESLPSTNTWLNQRLQIESLPEGTIVIARNQTEGRGQRGNSWISKPGDSLTMSLLLNPKNLSPSQQFSLSQAISLAIHDLLVYCQIPDPKIKWPNDLMSQEYKIGGVLIENSIRKEALQYSVVGIGLNINQTQFPENLDSATSLKLSSGLEFNTSKVIADLCSFLEKRYLQLHSGKLKEIETEYLSKIYRMSDWHSFEDSSGIFKGRITGVSNSGQIRIEDECGDFRMFSTKEVRYL